LTGIREKHAGACTRSARRCARGSSSATPSRLRSQASPAVYGRSRTLYVNLSTLGLDRAATVLIILVLGGYGRLYGAFVGAVAYMAITHFLSKVYPTAWQLGLGLLLVMIALFARNGILGLFDTLLRRAGVKRSSFMTETLIETRNVSKNFGALRASRDINFQLEAGARHALIAPTAPAKTTFINLLTGVLAPTTGEVFYKGADITNVAQANASARIARTFQINRLFRGLSVLEKRLHGDRRACRAAPTMLRPAGKRRDVIDESMQLLETLKLADYAHLRVSELPYGASAGRTRHHARIEARSAAARRAGRRRAQRRKSYHP